MLPALIIPGLLKAVLALLGIVSALALGFLIYRLIVRPALTARLDIDAPPPQEGFAFEIVLDQTRSRRVSVGQLDSDIKTRLAGVKEDHVALEFEKERDTEDYHITIVPGGNVFWRPPHAKKIEPLRASELFESRELIGHPAAFRVAALVKDNRPLQYIEFELSTGFFINRFGEEKMKFTLLLSKVYPGVDVESRTKQGLYNFGRQQMDQDSDAAAEEAPDDEQS